MNVLPPAHERTPDGPGILAQPAPPSHEPDEVLGRLLGDFTALAGQLCETPIVMVSQLHGHFTPPAPDGGKGHDHLPARRQWWRFPGQTAVLRSNTDFNLCEAAAGSAEALTEIADLPAHACYAASPMVSGVPRVRFYAGAAFGDAEGSFLGTLCVLDRQARRLNASQRAALPLLARNLAERLAMQREIHRLQQQVLTDGLTGVGNRRAFDQRLHEEWARHLRSGTPLSLLMIDVNRFKQYNDTHGHPAGDNALVKLGQLLRMPLRSSDFVARIGGDEFAVVLPDTPESSARLVAGRIHATIAGALWPLQRISISVGIASVSPAENCDFGALLQRADHDLAPVSRTPL
ncbi:MAG: Phytochrome-like protein cph2 [Herbaspirillum frisingense]|uniref:diguanylate cyclase n=1 Tax=Herbaspirillum frisingense TaxID=92645 RepID=A0A7V8FT13_9BURK|nr:MAG: Phytochrome-like protein cph2 [Herbaspirillum frisingense]